MHAYKQKTTHILYLHNNVFMRVFVFKDQLVYREHIMYSKYNLSLWSSQKPLSIKTGSKMSFSPFLTIFPDYVLLKRKDLILRKTRKSGNSIMNFQTLKSITLQTLICQPKNFLEMVKVNYEIKRLCHKIIFHCTCSVKF